MADPSRQPNLTSKWILLVAKLLAATQSREIRWESDIQGRFTTEFMGKAFRLDDFDDEIRLHFLDDAGQSVYTVPPVEGLSDLYEAVRFQIADIDQFLEKLAQ